MTDPRSVKALEALLDQCRQAQELCSVRTLSADQVVEIGQKVQAMKQFARSEHAFLLSQPDDMTSTPEVKAVCNTLVWLSDHRLKEHPFYVLSRLQEDLEKDLRKLS